MTQSPIEQLLAALDGLDVDRAAALLTPDIRMVLADGRHAVGAAEVRSLLSSFVVRANTEGIFEMHAYGVYEQTLSEHQGAQEGLRVGGRWFPPL